MVIQNVLIVTDAWRHGRQLNGVAVTYEKVRDYLPGLGVTPRFITPASFKTLPCPTYPDIRLALPFGLKKMLEAEYRKGFDALHIATEGPLGWAALRWAKKRNIPFTTSYHTRFPEYVATRMPKALKKTALRMSYAVVRQFHNAGARVFVPTPSMQNLLADNGINKLAIWTRGVDTTLFRPLPRAETALSHIDGRIVMYFGRIAPEKGIDDFLKLPLPADCTKVVVGDGPELPKLQRRYPETVFCGRQVGEDLVRHVAAADAFVFPSRTDTFGNVVIESLACGVPVAAYPVTGPKDVLGDAPVGGLDEDLGKALDKALQAKREDCRTFVCNTYSITTAMQQFIDNLEPIRRS